MSRTRGRVGWNTITRSVSELVRNPVRHYREAVSGKPRVVLTRAEPPNQKLGLGDRLGYKQNFFSKLFVVSGIGLQIQERKWFSICYWIVEL